MFIVRDVLIAKPGSAGKLAKLMKEVMALMGNGKATVLLDFVTDFNKIVIEHHIETLAAFEKEMEDYKKNPDPQLMEKMKGYTDLYQTGYREIYKVVE
ncbi:MAG TPA: hypothetical protein VJK51_04775 [Candidatus Nanoarchaeia archaeon]|nr:hypothetical protein [Candidatus Nanoarchaeia archaeon]